jgi:hypothetical protein
VGEETTDFTGEPAIATSLILTGNMEHLTRHLNTRLTRYAGSKWVIKRQAKEPINLKAVELCLTFPTAPNASRPATFEFGVPAGGNNVWRGALACAGFVA